MAWGSRFWIRVVIIMGIMAIVYYIALPGCHEIVNQVYGALNEWPPVDWCGLLWSVVFTGGVLILLGMFGLEALRGYRDE